MNSYNLRGQPSHALSSGLNLITKLRVETAFGFVRGTDEYLMQVLDILSSPQLDVVEEERSIRNQATITKCNRSLVNECRIALAMSGHGAMPTESASIVKGGRRVH